MDVCTVMRYVQKKTLSFSGLLTRMYGELTHLVSVLSAKKTWNKDVPYFSFCKWYTRRLIILVITLVELLICTKQTSCTKGVSIWCFWLGSQVQSLYRMWLLFLELGSMQDPGNPNSGLGLALIAVKNERIWDHPKANSIACRCAWKSQFSIMGQEVSLIDVFVFSCPRTVVEGKEVDR